MGRTQGFKYLKGVRRRLLLLMLVISMLLPTMCLPAQAVSGTKNSTSRAIAIVFDNSGSMYTQQNKAWCRATYAIEVFASIMNEGDTLQVYPMYDVTVAGKTYSSLSPFTIHGGDDTSVIQSMYTPFAGDTPIETIGDAYRGLKDIGADEQWLIVLTDGAVFYENGDPLNGNATKTRLEEVLTECNRDVNVLYLGIDPVAVMPEITENGVYQYYSDKAVDSRDTLTKLTEMCNIIFGRDVLANAGKELSFDVSMRKLILFVQGSGISKVTLTDANGKSVGTPSLKYSPRYGEMGAGTVRRDGTPLRFSTDTSLSGYIAIYDMELDAGSYQLNYSGDVSNVSVYYEPDVDLVAILRDEYDTVITKDTPLYPGKYRITYGLVDKNGNLTTSKLLGKTDFAITYYINDEPYTDRSSTAGEVEVELQEGDTLDAKITATYLSGYTITKTAEAFNWPTDGFTTVARPAGTLEVRISGGQETYGLSELEEKGVYKMQLVYDGAPVTGEQLAAAETAVVLEGGNADYTVTRAEDGLLLNLKHSGRAEDTVCGEYLLHTMVRYTDPLGAVAVSDEIQIPFSVYDNGYTLEMEADGPKYFVIKKLENGGPIKLHLSADGTPLTDKQLEEVDIDISGDGLTCEYEHLYGESAVAVRIVPDENAKPGRYSMNFRATAEDQLGRPVSAEDDMNIRVSRVPRWIVILGILLFIALILLLIWLYMNTKVLPKQITLNHPQTVFIVDGNPVKGAAKFKYTGGGKRNGTIHISLPSYPDNSMVKGGFNLNVTAASPRRVKSANRRVMVTKLSPINPAALQTLSVTTHNLVKVDEGDGVVWLFDTKQVASPNVTTQFEIGGKPMSTVVGETITGETFTMTAQMLFK